MNLREPMHDRALPQVLQQVGAVVLGKEREIKLATACLLARGHLLIEDLPGMGKTTLAHALAAALGLDFNRVQFTSDLMPADILGGAIFNRAAECFVFHPGPVFTQVLLADEINRAPPKTQSALLEAMEEGQVSSDGETRPLPQPFFVIATQNPNSQMGTFPLPESQLDRFLMRISLGYPARAAERRLFEGLDARAALAALRPALAEGELARLQAQVEQVRASPALLDYFQALVHETRSEGRFTHALSPRGALAWLRAARAWACLSGRDFLVPDDLQAVAAPVLCHRLHARQAELQAGLLDRVDAEHPPRMR